MGVQPCATSVSAARTPAGPPPTMTARTLLTPGMDAHPLHDERAARAHASLGSEPHPAVLACAHQAETRAGTLARLGRPQVRVLCQDRGQHRVACASYERLPFELDAHERALFA